MYRSRMSKKLNEIILNYVSSISDDVEIAFYDIIGSQAHSIMLYENKILTKNETKKILSALEKLKKEKFEKKSNSEDIHELIESLVIKNAGLASGGKMHTARSRNDQVSLDIRMKIRDDINILCQYLLDTIEALVSLAQAHHKNCNAIIHSFTTGPGRCLFSLSFSLRRCSISGRRPIICYLWTS